MAESMVRNLLIYAFNLYTQFEDQLADVEISWSFEKFW